VLNRNRIGKRGKKIAGSLDDGLAFICSWDAKANAKREHKDPREKKEKASVLDQSFFLSS
jgi:hypothetical protein